MIYFVVHMLFDYIWIFCNFFWIIFFNLWTTQIHFIFLFEQLVSPRCSPQMWCIYYYLCTFMSKTRCPVSRMFIFCLMQKLLLNNFCCATLQKDVCLVLIHCGIFIIFLVYTNDETYLWYIFICSVVQNIIIFSCQAVLGNLHFEWKKSEIFLIVMLVSFCNLFNFHSYF